MAGEQPHRFDFGSCASSNQTSGFNLECCSDRADVGNELTHSADQFYSTSGR